MTTKSLVCVISWVYEKCLKGVVDQLSLDGQSSIDGSNCMARLQDSDCVTCKFAECSLISGRLILMIPAIAFKP